ncbi:lysylphosphatidylglycerol synthase transmembrane domain-containing protein [candidate division CSSED10-310 bacterium]|uniref:Lysylphosphatidylglycerol synthase transmembrane domain-containing protein n=1 Tax=candidate division CSSED10-310 bacterium TaxID=2855610 RepID=A0ABV6YUV4_UNCC1
MGIIISLVFLTLLVVNVDLSASLRVLTRLDVHHLLIPFILSIFALLCRPWRWQIIFTASARPRYGSCFKVHSISLMSNNLLPIRGGDMLRCFLIAREKPFPGLSVSIASLVLEKLLDGLALLVIVLTTFMFITPPQWLARLAMIAGLIFGSTLFLLICLRILPHRIQTMVQYSVHWIPLKGLKARIVAIFQRFSGGLTGIRSLPQLGALLILTGFTWVTEAAIFWAMAPVLNISLSIPAAFVISAVLGLGLMIPAGPAFIGSYEFFIVSTMGLFGIESEVALALALVLHAWVIVITTGIGFAVMGGSGIQLFHLSSTKYEKHNNSETDIRSN